MLLILFQLGIKLESFVMALAGHRCNHVNLGDSDEVADHCDCPIVLACVSAGYQLCHWKPKAL